MAPKTTANIKRLKEILEDPENGLPQVGTDVGSIYFGQIATLTEQISRLEKQVRIEATRDDNARRLQTMPGIGPITAMAVSAFAPPMEIFRRGRDFAAWVGLVPKQHSTGGKQKLGRTSNPLGTMLRMTLTGNGWGRERSAGFWSSVPCPS